MGTVTVLTAERALELASAAVVGAIIDENGDLILTKQDGTTINAGTAFTTIPDASDTVKGVVELATNAEAISGTDNTRAITPASLAARELSRSDLLVTHIDVAKSQSALPSTYPVGISIMALNPTTVTSGGWTGLSSIFGSSSTEGIVHTVIPHTGNPVQYFYRSGSASIVPGTALRCGNASGWGTWQRLLMYSEFNDTITKLPYSMASGSILITPSAANTPTAATVSFPAGRFTASPTVMVTAMSGVIGTTVLGVSAINVTTTSADIIITRTNTTATLVYWLATEM